MPRAFVPALALIALGSLFLLDNLGLAGIDVENLISTWWPLAPILIGVHLLLPRRHAPGDSPGTTDAN